MARPKHLSYIILSYELLTSNLSDKEQKVLGNIIGVVQGGGEYRFDNKWISDYLRTHPNSASRIVSSLQSKGLIDVKLIKIEGTNAIKYRIITLTSRCINTYVNTPINTSVDTPINTSVKHNNKYTLVNKQDSNTKLADRQNEFIISVKSFSEHSDYHEEFINYWTEPNRSGTKLRFEMERTWDTRRRLHQWRRNHETNFGRNSVDAEAKWEESLRNKYGS